MFLLVFMSEKATCATVPAFRIVGIFRSSKNQNTKSVRCSIAFACFANAKTDGIDQSLVCQPPLQP